MSQNQRGFTNFHRGGLVRGLLGIAVALGIAFGGGAAGAEDEAGKDAAKKGDSKMVEAGSKVGIEYTLTLEDGTKVDSNVGGEALRFEQGTGQIIPGLDKQLIGMKISDAKKVTVTADEGYGAVNPEAFTDVPVDQLPEDARTAGTMLMTQDPQGRPMRLRVHKVEGETATLDFNHPLAGQTLFFDVKVLEIQ